MATSESGAAAPVVSDRDPARIPVHRRPIIALHPPPSLSVPTIHFERKRNQVAHLGRAYQSANPAKNAAPSRSVDVVTPTAHSAIVSPITPHPLPTFRSYRSPVHSRRIDARRQSSSSARRRSLKHSIFVIAASYRNPLLILLEHSRARVDEKRTNSGRLLLLLEARALITRNVTH